MNRTREDVLNGWKEIAAYLGRDPRTVERWEKQRSLPVRRLPGSGRATVYALVPELDAWLARPQVQDVPSAPPEEAEIAESPLPTPVVPAPVPVTAAAPALTSEASTRGEEGAGSGRKRRWLWLRWAVPVLGLLVVGSIGYTAAGWKRGHLHPAAPRGSVEPGRLRKMVPSSAVPGVEELYLRGSYQTELRTPESLRRAQECFSNAIRKDPQYAPAYAGLANTFLLLREYSMLPDTEAYPKAVAAASRALALDPNWPQAHAAMGFADFFWRWDGVAAEQQFKRALAADPDLPLAHHWYGSVLTHEGRFREGAAELSTAQRLDPSSGAILATRALALGLSGKRDEASEMLREAIAHDSTGHDRNPATMHSVLGILSLLPPRDISRYVAESTLSAELRQDTQTAETMQRAASVYRTRGEQAMWRVLLDEETSRHRAGGPTYQMARYEAELGARDEALNDFSDLFSRHDPALIGISVDPLLWSLHRDPRFRQLRAAMGLPALEGD